MIKNLHILAAALVLTVPTAAAAQSAFDRAAVERAALDYIEGFYEGEGMPWTEFMSYANQVRSSGRPTPASAPRGVQVLDVLDQIAAVKVTAWWGVDYLLLARYNGRWMIRQVLWQSPPR